jgi:hypothetical protein
LQGRDNSSTLKLITDMNKYMTYEERLDRMRDHGDFDDENDWDANTHWAKVKQRESDRELRESERFDP